MSQFLKLQSIIDKKGTQKIKTKTRAPSSLRSTITAEDLEKAEIDK
jgi:hypothetical protein